MYRLRAGPWIIRPPLDRDIDPNTHHSSQLLWSPAGETSSQDRKLAWTKLALQHQIHPKIDMINKTSKAQETKNNNQRFKVGLRQNYSITKKFVNFLVHHLYLKNNLYTIGAIKVELIIYVLAFTLTHYKHYDFNFILFRKPLIKLLSLLIWPN